MSESQKDCYIDYLADRVTTLDLDKRAMELVLEDFLKAQQQMLEKIASLESGQKALQNSLDEETRKRKAAERKVQYLDERLNMPIPIVSVTKINSMLHFGSDEGVEMATTYHSIISTVKLHGKSAWNFLGTFFKKIFNGCRDFLCLTPGNIEMAVCQ